MSLAALRVKLSAVRLIAVYPSRIFPATCFFLQKTQLSSNICKDISLQKPHLVIAECIQRIDY